MRCVVQRVSSAHVLSDGVPVGQIQRGIVALIGVMAGDGEKDMKYIKDKVMNLRIFEDENDKMNLSVVDVGGSILAVSQFTLLGDARGGRRPSFIEAAPPDTANALYEALTAAWRAEGIPVETGVFRTHMEVSLVNDGPVTLLLDSRKTF